MKASAFRSNPARDGYGFERQIARTNEWYQQDNLALIRPLNPIIIPFGTLKGRPVFIPVKKVEGDLKGAIAPGVLHDHPIPFHAELKARLSWRKARRTFSLRKIPEPEQVQELDAAVLFGFWTVLVLYAQFKGMEGPVVARIDWTGEDVLLDAEMLERYRVPWKGMLPDYLGLYQDLRPNMLDYWQRVGEIPR